MEKHKRNQKLRVVNWSAGLQQCCLSMPFAKGRTIPESLDDRSAKCVSFPHLSITQNPAIVRLVWPTGLHRPSVVTLQCFLCLKQLPYRASVTLNPIIDFFKCRFIQRGTVAFWKAETWAQCSSPFASVLPVALCPAVIQTCSMCMYLPWCSALVFLRPPPPAPLFLTSGYTPARPLAPSQQPLQWAPFRASHHSAASRVAFTGARAWTALISLTPMWVNCLYCKHDSFMSCIAWSQTKLCMTWNVEN